MILSSALGFVADVPRRPIESQTALPVLGVNADRVNKLRCLLLIRDLVEQSRDQSCFTRPVMLGQWRN
jgi:hypothetical protein